MRRALAALLWSTLIAATAVLLLHLVVNVDVGDGSISDLQSLLACALLVTVPALVFLPINSKLGAPFFDAEAVLGWSTLGFVVIFFTPHDSLSYGQFLAVLLPVTVSIASIGTLLAYPFVTRLRPYGSKASNVMRCRRIGYLAAVALIAMVLLASLGLLTPFNGTLVVAVAVLAELFARGQGHPPRPVH